MRSRSVCPAVLTYRTGAAGLPPAARAMAQYYLSQTVPALEPSLARYYQGEAGIAQPDYLLAALAQRVAADPDQRTDAAAMLAEARAPRTTAIERAALDVYAGRAEYSDALHPLLSEAIHAAGSIEEQEAAEDRTERRFNAALDFLVDQEVAAARDIDAAVADLIRGSPGARLRPDTDPELLRLLGAEHMLPLGEDQIANLLNGLTTTGAMIAGKHYEKPSRTKTPIGFIDLTFSADKSVSIAWAFAPSEAERALIMGAHRDAVDAATEYAAGQIGRLRKGHGGRDGWEYGAVTWLAFEHHAARPTIEVARVDSHGQAYTERLTLKVTGDPQLHTHRVLPNVTLSRSGRVGGLHLGRLEGRVHEIGASYQAQLATHLRRAGIPTLLDPETGAAYIPGIPRSVREAFSKRTREASHAAR